MTERRFAGSISDRGKLELQEPDAFRSVLRDLAGLQVILCIDKARTVRSVQAGRYYWSCIVQAFQDTWSLARVRLGLEPLTKDETHDVLVQVLLGCEDGPVPGTRLRRRTAPMDSAEFANYIDRCLELARTQYDMLIPSQGRSDAD